MCVWGGGGIVVVVVPFPSFCSKSLLKAKPLFSVSVCVCVCVCLCVVFTALFVNTVGELGIATSEWDGTKFKYETPFTF